jgi:hypothetical protein
MNVAQLDKLRQDLPNARKKYVTLILEQVPIRIRDTKKETSTTVKKKTATRKTIQKKTATKTAKKALPEKTPKTVVRTIRPKTIHSLLQRSHTENQFKRIQQWLRNKILLL